MRLAILLACALSLSACADALSAGEAPFAQPDFSGSLRIPLSAESGDGTEFRLRNAEFELSGSAMLTVSERDGGRNRKALVTRLPAGEYTIFLRPGWRLVQRDGSGTEVTASAELLSPNPMTLVVNELGDESIQLMFKQGEQELRFGSGAVQITRADQLPQRLAL